MSVNEQIYNIVVLGAMNPRLHTPGWYRLVGLIDDAELSEASEGEVVVLAPIAKWQIKGFGVVCLPDRWEVQTTIAQNLERLQRFASRVFDDLLEHTPVRALGFNFNYERATDDPHLSRSLASFVVRTQIGMNEDCLVAGEMSLRRNADGRVVNVTVRSCEKDNATAMVNVCNNFEYTFANQESPAFFRLQDKISSRFSIDLEEAEEQTARIVSSINKSVEGR